MEGTYVESCNCDAICPCRTINGVRGGRSTHGICEGALSWRIEGGSADGVDLGGLNVALASRYSDDEQGSPWDFVLFLDERAARPQVDALEAIWTGRLGGSVLDHFPWAWKASRLLAVRQARIEIDHTRRRQWFRVGKEVSVRIAGPFVDQGAVTCVIPGHHRSGEELIAAELDVADELLAFGYRGTCGYAADFRYEG